MYFKEKKAQTALELILIVGGVIVLATIIGYYVKTQVVKAQDAKKFKEIIDKTAGTKQ